MPVQKLKLLTRGAVTSLLLITAAAMLTGCGNATAAADTPLHPLPCTELAAQKACPPGHEVQWISRNEMQCLKVIND